MQLNKERLKKQSRQIINSAFTQIAYIQRECKHYLSDFQQSKVPLLRTNERKNFQLLVEKKESHPSFISNYHELITLNNNGRYVIFPKGNYSIAWNEKSPNFEHSNFQTILEQWTFENLKEAMDKDATVVITSDKIYFLEYQMVLSILNRIKTMFLGKF